jgi:YD repeat-containing protein
MKRTFIFCLISILLSGSLFAQKVTRRLFVGIDGPVKSVRLEVAKLTPDGDSVVEGPRILSGADEANEDGSLKISRRYRPDGIVNFKQVTSHLPDGRAKESLVYLDEEKLATRMLYHYDSGGNRIEMFHYSADGTIDSTAIKYLDGSLSLIEGETIDKSGNLREHEVSTRTVSGLSEQTRSLYKDGRMSGKVVMVILSARQNEQRSYDAEGVLKSKILTTVDQKGEWVERATYDAEGKLREKVNYEMEYDTRGNWIKQVVSKWNPQTEKSEMTQVYYRAITYYEH